MDAEGEEVRRRTAIDGNAAVPVRPLASSVDDPNLSAELELHLQQAKSGHSSVREGEREKLSREREELLNRMKEKVRILREDELEVEADMRSVREEGERLVGLVEEQSSFVEGDKVRVHLQEVERLINLEEMDRDWEQLKDRKKEQAERKRLRPGEQVGIEDGEQIGGAKKKGRRMR